jgi:hypothetical protein
VKTVKEKLSKESKFPFFFKIIPAIELKITGL